MKRLIFLGTLVAGCFLDLSGLRSIDFHEATTDRPPKGFDSSISWREAMDIAATTLREHLRGGGSPGPEDSTWSAYVSVYAQDADSAFLSRFRDLPIAVRPRSGYMSGRGRVFDVWSARWGWPGEVEVTVIAYAEGGEDDWRYVLRHTRQGWRVHQRELLWMIRA